MITVKEKLKLLSQCLGSTKISNSGENVNVVCPACEHSGKITSKKKLSINLEKGIYHCWVCNTKGPNIGRFCLKMGLCNDTSKALLNVYGSKTNNIENEVQSIIKPKLPDDFVLLHDKSRSKKYKQHYQYLISRGFDKVKIKKFRVGASNSFEYYNKVIFPSFDRNSDLNYFISRTIIPNSSYRYKNFEGSRKDIIFKEIDLDFKKPLVLVEGVFDLVNCPDNSTCILGSWLDINYKLFKEIVKNKTPVTLCFDPDAKEKSLKIAKLLYEYCIDVKLSQHTDKDFGDMGPEEVKYFIETAKQFDNANLVRYLINNISSGSII